MNEQVMVRTSERSTFKRCRWKWEREFIDLLKPITAAPPLRFGSLVHGAMEAYYRPGLKRGPKPAETFEKLYEADLEKHGNLGFRDEDGKWADAGQMGIVMLESYFDLYGKDNQYKVLVTEQPFEVPILNPRNGKVVAQYVGIVDGIWEDRSSGAIFIMDHKTAASISIGHLPLDEQASAYWTFGQEWIRSKGMLKPDQKLSGMMYNFLRKAFPDERPQNDAGHYLNKPKKDALVAECERLSLDVPAKLTVDSLIEFLGPKALRLGEVSSSQPPPYFLRHPVWRDEAEQEKVRERVFEELRDMNLVRKGEAGAYKNPGPFTCAGCGFRDICELEETGADWEAMRDQTMTTWTPYGEHEIYEGR